MLMCKKLEKDIENAAGIIKSGGLVAYPTETVYGIGADPFNRIAVLKVFGIKRRELDKPLLVAVSNFDQMDELVFTNRTARKLYKQFLPGPLTLILKKKAVLPKELTSGSNKLGIRVPDNEIALRLIELAGPITSTSANLSGKENPTSYTDVKKQFGEKLDMVINGGITKLGLPSTVVDITEDEPVIIREGTIKKGDILKTLSN